MPIGEGVLAVFRTYFRELLEDHGMDVVDLPFTKEALVSIAPKHRARPAPAACAAFRRSHGRRSGRRRLTPGTALRRRSGARRLGNGD